MTLKVLTILTAIITSQLVFHSHSKTVQNQYIRSKKTKEYVAVDWPVPGFKYLKTIPKQLNQTEWKYVWDLDYSEGYIIIKVHDYPTYKWDNQEGCNKGVYNVGVYSKVPAGQNKFTFDPNTGILKVCDNNCIFKNEENQKISSTSDCSTQDDKLFYLEPANKRNSVIESTKVNA